MIGLRRIGLIAIACVLAVVGAISVLSIGVSNPTPPRASGPGAPVVTNVVSGQWVSRGETRVGSVVKAQLKLSSVEPLHDIQVTFRTNGPMSLRGPHSFAIGTMDERSRNLEVPVVGRGPGGGYVMASIKALNAADQSVNGDAENLYFAADSASTTFSNVSELNAQVGLLNLHRAAMGPAEYQQKLNSLEGGGAIVRIAQSPLPIGPHTLRANDLTSATTTVSGQIQWTSSDGSLHPARDVMVQVWDLDPSLPGGEARSL